MTVSVLLLFLGVPWVGLQCMIVVFPGHTHLLYEGPDGIQNITNHYKFMSVISNK